MPHRSMPIPLLAFAVVLLGSVPTVHAGQEASPVPGTPVVASDEGGAGSAPLLRLVLTEPPGDEVAVVGITRTTYAPGAGLRGSAGGGPLVLFVETGALLVRSIDAPGPILVVDPGAGPASGTPEPVPTGDERRLAAGTALVVPAGGVAEIRNAGGDPATTLALLAVTPDGEIDLIADLSEGHLVAVGVALAPDGGAYVGHETVVPYPEGLAKVVHVAADGTVTDHWTGLTAMTDLAMGPDDALYAAEMATNNTEEPPYLRPGSGRVVRQTGPESLEPVVTDIEYPVYLGFDPDGALYLTYLAFAPNAGEGQGALLRIDLASGDPISLAGLGDLAPTCGEGSAATPAP